MLGVPNSWLMESGNWIGFPLRYLMFRHELIDDRSTISHSRNPAKCGLRRVFVLKNTDTTEH